jgi:hypothetical protein
MTGSSNGELANREFSPHSRRRERAWVCVWVVEGVGVIISGLEVGGVPEGGICLSIEMG